MTPGFVVYLIGCAVMFLVGYYPVRKYMIDTENPEEGADQLMVELGAITATLIAGVAWPIVIAAYGITKFHARKDKGNKGGVVK